MIRLALSLAVLLLVAPAAPLAAQEAAAAATSDPYLNFVRTVTGGVDNEVMLQRGLAQIGEAMLASDPAIAELEALFPGAVDQMLVAMTPMMREHSETLRSRFEVQYADLLRDELTVAEARDAAAFYASPVGRRLLTSIQDNMTYDAQIDDVDNGEWEGTITTSSINEDLRATQRAVLDEVSPADMAAMDRRAANSTWLPKIARLRPQVIALRAQVENAPMDPELEARGQAAVAAVVERLLAQAPKPQPVRRK